MGSEPQSGAVLELTEEELRAVVGDLGLEPEDGSPLDPREFVPQPSEQTRTPVDRERLRRTLIILQPDARIVVSHGSAGAPKTRDVYGRAGAFIPFTRTANSFELGAPRELTQVFEEIVSLFSPRRATTDVVDLALPPDEAYVFMVLVAETMRGRRGGSAAAVRVGRTLPERSLASVLELVAQPQVQTTTTKRIARLTPAMFDDARVFSLTSESGWLRALESLAFKQVIRPAGQDFELHPRLNDLATSLVLQNRELITRFDFGERDWVVRDATLVTVSSSVFFLRPMFDGTLIVKELDKLTLENAVRRTIDEIPEGDTAA